MRRRRRAWLDSTRRRSASYRGRCCMHCVCLLLLSLHASSPGAREGKRLWHSETIMVSIAASGGDDASGTKQKVETMEEGETNQDGSVVVSKKMTRVVTTTRTTAPGKRSL